jgi:hypothetical protein
MKGNSTNTNFEASIMNLLKHDKRQTYQYQFLSNKRNADEIKQSNY